MDGPLAGFSPATRAWFERSFAAPTAAQAEGWPPIRRGDHTLILAPTGSGKTLAAFLWALDQLAAEPTPAVEADRCRVLYVSPLKALTYDVERNLRGPLAGLALEAERAGLPAPDVRVGTRTGDTPPADRRRLQRHPPDILITTPESLFLLLTSSAREILRSVEHVIVDEIHAVAGTKRGAHLAVSLERLERLVTARGRRPPQRVGLSATQRPLDEIARFLGGGQRDERTGEWRDRPVTIVDAGMRKPLELEIVVPIEDMGELGTPLSDDLQAAAAGPVARLSIWPAIYPRLLDLIREHRSTLVFVNSRRLAERLAGALNELAGEELVRAHHGSIAREQRLEIEDLLKAGKLPALVATSSLELGIDMGAIDLVVQVEAPVSVASGLQRIGRAGHQVGEPSKGRIFPKFRGDLVVAAVAAQRMQAGAIEQTVVPRHPLDVLAQQIVAMVAMEELSVNDVATTVGAAYPYRDLPMGQLEAVLDMLAGRYPSDAFAELRPRLVWDRAAGVLRARAGAQRLAVTSGGTIPDRGLYGVFTPDGVRVGELDEEMVYESRVGDTFLLGATTWRMEEITRDRVIVTPAPGEPGRMPFWRGDGVGRPYELGAAIGEFLRRLDSISDDQLAEECGLDALARRNLRAYVDEEREVTGGLLPTDRQVVVERFRDELGDWRVCVLSPFGARVHAPWALAVEAKLRDRAGVECQVMWTDDGIVVRLPEADDAPLVESLLLDPEEVRDLVVEQLGGSALFAARFRENAARALLLPRRRPGSRTPLWQMRQRAADLLAVASQHGDFPIVLETYRECLRDVFDLDNLERLMRDVRSRAVRVSEVEVVSPSPFASSLVFAYVASFLYDGDAPLAERRAQALTLDRAMLAELLGTDELRDLLDVEAVATVEARLQALDERWWARDADEAHDLLRRLGDLAAAELAARCVPGAGPTIVADLLSSRRALGVRLAGDDRLIAAEDAGRYRDALGVALPTGVPDAFLGAVPDPLASLLERFARTHAPFLTTDVAERFGIGPEVAAAVLHTLRADERVLWGDFRPGGTEKEWCHPEVLRLIRQRSLAALRREVEPVEPEALARFLPAWHGVGSAARGLARLAEVVAQLQGLALPASVLERDILPQRVRDYTPRLLDELMAAGEVLWVGAGPLGRADGRVRLFLRGDAGLLIPGMERGAADEPPAADEHERLRALLAHRGACFFADLRGPADHEALEALWDLVWAGEVTNDTFAPLRALGARRRSPAAARASRGRPRLGALRAAGPPTGQGRWSLVAHVVAEQPDATAVVHAVARMLLERHGILTREAVRGEGIPRGFAGVYPVLRVMEEAGRVRRGYFIERMGGAQFALPGAVDRLRARRAPGYEPEIVVLAATDPANAYGFALPWPVKGPQRAAGAFVVLLDGLPVLYVERGGKSLVALRDPDGEWESLAVGALDALLGEGRLKRLAFTAVDDGLVPALAAAGFTRTPKGWVRYG